MFIIIVIIIIVAKSAVNYVPSFAVSTLSCCAFYLLFSS